MGGTRSSSVDWSSYSQSTATKTQSFSQAYTNRSGIKDEYHPRNIKVRESRDSVANPNSTPIIIALDCTGSMNDIALSAKKNIGTLMAEVYDRSPVSDPHVMVMFFDDVFVSRSEALQVTQFEADRIIIDQMEELYWVGNGGGNGSESYNLPIHFAVNHCECDAFAKNRKGFLFIMGDDGVPPALTTDQLRAVYGPDYEAIEPLDFKDLLQQAEENWHVFFIYPTRGGRMNSYVAEGWRSVIGERFITLDDVDKLAEVLVATMQVISGADAAAVAASFKDPGTSLVVANAIKDLIPKGVDQGVVRLNK